MRGIAQSVQSVGWYLRRIRVMTMAELGYRLKERFVLVLLSLRYRYGRGFADEVPPVGSARFCTASDHQLSELDVDDSVLPDTEDLLAGQWHALGFGWRWTSSPDVWRYAPDTGELWPREFFGRIAYRSGNPYGDIRVLWEPARLQQLVALALVARRESGSASRQAIRLLKAQLLSWNSCNPPLEGPHYVSAMECALRVIAVCHAVDLVRHKLPVNDPVWQAVLCIVASHAPLISKRLSLYSSAGNHTVAECAGLVYAGLLFPEFTDAHQWVDRGLPLLVSEIDRQVLSDGGGVEQAFWYLLLVADLAGLVIGLLRKMRRDVPEALDEAYKRARVFLSAFATRPAALPHIGDRDDGYALLPGLKMALGHEKQNDDGPIKTFPVSGYTLLRKSAFPGMEVVFDHGPLGMPPSFGHGHADALSVYVSCDSEELLVDSGTFTYTGDPQLRKYFRSTLAHNTVVVDGKSQAMQQTSFMWSDPYTARLVQAQSAADWTAVLACHDGYSKDGVTHWRGLVVGPWGLLIWDRLGGTGRHRLDVMWHSARSVVRSEGRVRIGDRFDLIGTGVDCLVCEPIEGRPETRVRSCHYGILDQAWVVRGEWTGELPHALWTAILSRDRQLPSDKMMFFQDTFEHWIRSGQEE